MCHSPKVTILYLVDRCGQVPMSADALHLWQVLVALNQSLLVLMLLTLSGKESARLSTGMCLQHDMRATWENIPSVGILTM